MKTLLFGFIFVFGAFMVAGCQSDDAAVCTNCVDKCPCVDAECICDNNICKCPSCIS